MTKPFSIRRDCDGAIDFDFYRRRATRQRRLAQRLAIRKAIAAVARALRAVVARAARSRARPSGAPPRVVAGPQVLRMS